ncbi:MAG: T9SS type A sorting domain-containing protein [Ignavibacteria bacterium]|jgi:hypothetical protein
MKKYLLLFIFFLITTPLLINAQSYIDPSREVEAKVFAYKMSSAPTIDALESEWDDIPWTEIRYNDRDFNDDDLIDPMSSRDDYRARWKAAWIDGSNKIYFLFETYDDVIYTADSVKQSHRDNLSIRLDPYDEEIAGEPFDDASKNSFSMRFQIDNAENTGYEGNDNVKPESESYAIVYDDQFPIRTVMEVALTLPDNLALTEGYVMGYFPLLADNDPEDDSYNSKNTVPMQWPQMYCDLGAADHKNADGRLFPDQFWKNDFYWGNIECISLNVHEVSAGGSIQSALDAAIEGDIIKIAAGEFTENIEISTPYVQLVGTMTETDTTKLYPADGNSAVIKIAEDDEAYGVVVKNIAFYGWTDAESQTAGGKGIEIGSAQAEILGNYFEGFDDPILEGTDDTTKAYACVFEDNYLYICSGGINFCSPSTVMRYNTVVESSSGYALESRGLLVENSVDIAFNTVFNHHGECGVGYAGSGVFTIHHNMLVRSESLYGSGDTSGDDGTENQDDGGSTDYIYNNTIVGWKSDGIQLGGSSAGSSNYYVRNNLIAHCAAKDYDIRTVGSTDIDYGLSYGNGSNLIETLGSNFVVSDPLFTDEYEDDFTITESSPAVDAGEYEPFGFKVMYFGETVDIGAFETGTPTVTGIDSDESEALPNDYTLSQNYPNPFNPSTSISFSTPKAGMVKLQVFNILGEEVATLVNQELTAGTHNIVFDASQLVSGVYIYRIKADNFMATKKMLLLK